MSTDADGANALGVSIVLTTMPDAASAGAMVEALVEERLVACGNILPPITSIYRWEGRVMREAEVLVVLKASEKSIDRLFHRVAEMHPYSVPELVELPVGRVADAYRGWVMASTEGIA